MSLVDRYLYNSYQRGETIKIGEYQQIAIAAVLIASKYEDVHKISLQELYEEAGHRQISKEMILK